MIGQLPPFVVLLGLAAAVAMGGALALHVPPARRPGVRLEDLHADELLSVAHLRLEQDRFDEAHAIIELAMTKAPASALLRAELAHVEEQLGRPEEGLRLWREACAISDGDEDHFHVARVAAHLGQLDLAERHLLAAAARSREWAIEALDDEDLHDVVARPGVRAHLRRIAEAA